MGPGKCCNASCIPYNALPSAIGFARLLVAPSKQCVKASSATTSLILCGKVCANTGSIRITSGCTAMSYTLFLVKSSLTTIKPLVSSVPAYVVGHAIKITGFPICSYIIPFAKSITLPPPIAIIVSHCD